MFLCGRGEWVGDPVSYSVLKVARTFTTDRRLYEVRDVVPQRHFCPRIGP